MSDAGQTPNPALFRVNQLAAGDAGHQELTVANIVKISRCRRVFDLGNVVYAAFQRIPCCVAASYGGSI